MKYRSWCDQAIAARPLDRPAEAGLPWKALTCRRLRPDPVRQIRPTSWSLPVSQPTVLRLPELPARALLAPLRQVSVPEFRRMVPTPPEFQRTALAPLVFLSRVLALLVALPVSRGCRLGLWRFRCRGGCWPLGLRRWSSLWCCRGRRRLRQRNRIVALRAQEGDDIGAGREIREARERHHRARGERLRVCEP